MSFSGFASLDSGWSTGIEEIDGRMALYSGVVARVTRTGLAAVFGRFLGGAVEAWNAGVYGIVASKDEGESTEKRSLKLFNGLDLDTSNGLSVTGSAVLGFGGEAERLAERSGEGNFCLVASFLLLDDDETSQFLKIRSLNLLRFL